VSNTDRTDHTDHTDDGADEVLAAAAELMAAFSAHDAPGYFACFEPQATFLFHNVDHLIPSRAAYEEIWQEWERDGFQVLGCRSFEQRVQMVGDDAAVFSHRVRATLAGEDEVTPERETIIFHRGVDGRWLGVHEHLSLEPVAAQESQA
jgi:ketosteroid isomerase-like protein